MFNFLVIGMTNSHFRVRSIQAGLTMIIFRFVSFIWDYFLNAFIDIHTRSDFSLRNSSMFMVCLRLKLCRLVFLDGDLPGGGSERYFSGDVANSSGNLEERYAPRAACFLLWTSYEQRTQIQGPLPKHTLCHAWNSFNSTSYAQ